MPLVTLLPVRRSDAEDLVRANLASRAHHAPWVQTFTDEEGFEAWYAQTLTGAKVALVVRREDDGAVVGVFNFNEIVMGAFRSAYLGYFGMVGQARRGLMTEGLRLAVAYGFKEIGLHRIEANIQPGNAASIALVRRVGFRLEGFSPRYLKIDGQWRDHERWALLADEAAAG
jgi:[ribosomal protein S5]-alanine N-acetyltransferase